MSDAAIDLDEEERGRRYAATCPICGGTLEPVEDMSPDTPPWNCVHDRRLFWPAELTDESRRNFDPDTRAPRSARVARGIAKAVERDRERAMLRGSSNVPEHKTTPATEAPAQAAQVKEDKGGPDRKR